MLCTPALHIPPPQERFQKFGRLRVFRNELIASRTVYDKGVVQSGFNSVVELPANELAEKERRPVPFHVIINPVIARLADEKAHFYEGCLSLAGFSAVVPRARTIRVQYLDERGAARVVEASGWYARILQHEIDHLHGALYIDRMQSRTFTSLDNWNRFSKGRPIPAASRDAPKT